MKSRIWIFCSAILCIILPPLTAQAETSTFTGWLEKSTEHFTFIYEEQDSPAVAELLSYCEEVYTDVTGLLDSRPAHIDCVIRGRVDYTNGFFTILPNRLELYLNPPKEPGLKGPWLRLLLTHELTHYVHILYQHGFNSVAGDIFGDAVNGLLTAAEMPGWMVEGITTNTETIFTSGGRGRNYFFEMFYKAPVIEGELFSLRQAAYSSHLNPPNRIYVGGYILVDYLMRHYGRDVFSRIHKETIKPYRTLAGAVKKITGKNLDLLYRNMQGELTLRFHQDSLLPPGKRLSPEKQGNWYLPQATDRGLYLYRTTPGRRGAFVRFNPENGSEEVLLESSITDPYSFSVSPDGNLLIYARITEQSPRLGNTYADSELYKYSVDTGELTPITRGGHLWQPALSPDGSRLLAVQKNGHYSRLVEVDQTTGATKILFSHPGTTIYTPVFSPTGKKVAFVMKAGDMYDIYLLDMENAVPPGDEPLSGKYNTGAVTPLREPDIQGDYYPRFTSEDTLLFSSEREGALKLYTWDLNAGSYRLLCEDPVAAFAGVIYAGQLIYASYSSTGYSLKTPLEESALPGQPLPPPSTRELPAGQQLFQPEEGKPWLGLPKLMYWYPDFKFNVHPETGKIINPAYGIFLDSANLTMTGSLQLGLYYHLEANQLSGLLNTNFTKGKQRYYLGLAQDYGPASGQWRQTITPSAGIDSRLFYYRGLNTATEIWINSRLSYSFSITGEKNFACFSREAGGRAQDINFLNGIVFNCQEYSTTADIYGRDDLYLDLSGGLQWREPISWAPEPQVSTRFSGRLALPGGQHNLKAGLKAGWRNAGNAAALAAPRGNPEWQADSSQLHALGAIQYQLALPLMEINAGPLHLTGIGLGTFLEASTGYSQEQGLLWDNSLYNGFECTVLGGWYTAGVSFTVGVNTRLRLPDIFNPSKIIFYPYLAVGTDSFLNSL